MIQFVEGFFSKEELEMIMNDVNSSADKSKWRSNMFWTKDIVKKSSAVISLVLSEKMHKIIKDKFISINPEYGKYNFQCQFYLWYPFSYIPQHSDYLYKLACTIYLNEDWNIDHGGLFYYKDSSDKYRMVIPKFNNGVINTNNVWHGVTLLHPDAPYRTTVQIFCH